MPESRIANFVLILIAASAVALLVKVIPIPYVSALAIVGVLAGAILGARPPLDLHLTTDLILFALLPGLLFEAAFNLRWRELRSNLAAGVALATLGVLLTMGLVALLGSAALGLEVPVAVLFGAMIAPTDPVAVVAVFRRLHVPERLVNLIEAESLLNDGTGVVLFTIALAAVTTRLPLTSALLDFVRLAAGGLALGTAVGFGVSLLTSRIDDVQVEITLTAIAAYGGYLLAETIHVSGILTVVAAGLVIGNYARPRGMSEGTRHAVDVFWDYIAFALNSVVFLLIGFDVPLAALVSMAGAILAATAITVAARAVAVYLLLGSLHLVRSGVSLRWQHLIVWSGLRGAIAVALVLSLTNQGSQFDAVRALAYGVVLVSIVVQGATIGPAARLLLRPAGPVTSAPAGRLVRP